MLYYLAPYIGAGTSLDPFRPRGSDQLGWSAIDLRPDGGATLDGGGLNACLLALPAGNPDPQLMLVAQAPIDTIGASLKQALVTKLNLPTTPISTRWDSLVFELLSGPPPRGRQPLQATVDRGYEVWLGGLLKRVPTISGGASISENWNCADSADISCQLTWTKIAGTALKILASQLDSDDTGFAWAVGRAETALGGADHAAQVTVVSLTGTGTPAAACIIRKDSTGTLTYYHGDGIINNTPNNHRLFKRIAGTFTALGNSSTAFVAGEVLKVEANGSTIQVYKDSVSLINVTDTAITGNTFCGVGLFRGAADTATADNWSAADLAVASVVSPRTFALLGVGA